MILIVAPWSAFWERNFFAAVTPALQPVLDSPFVRGAVSGVGAVTALAGLAELGGIVASRRTRRPGAGPSASGTWKSDR